MDRFSKGNQHRILNQFPRATDVRSRTDWEKAGFHVHPRAFAIWIVAPTGWDRQGRPIGWKQCPVYDISQTLETSQENAA